MSFVDQLITLSIFFHFGARLIYVDFSEEITFEIPKKMGLLNIEKKLVNYFPKTAQDPHEYSPLPLLFPKNSQRNSKNSIAKYKYHLV